MTAGLVSVHELMSVSAVFCCHSCLHWIALDERAHEYLAHAKFDVGKLLNVPGALIDTAELSIYLCFIYQFAGHIKHLAHVKSGVGEVLQELPCAWKQT